MKCLAQVGIKKVQILYLWPKIHVILLAISFYFFPGHCCKKGKLVSNDFSQGAAMLWPEIFQEYDSKTNVEGSDYYLSSDKKWILYPIKEHGNYFYWSLGNNGQLHDRIIQSSKSVSCPSVIGNGWAYNRYWKYFNSTSNDFFPDSLSFICFCGEKFKSYIHIQLPYFLWFLNT